MYVGFGLGLGLGLGQRWNHSDADFFGKLTDLQR
jgi:hypothetical protein